MVGMQSYIDKAKKELGDFKSTGSKSTLSKTKSKTFRDQGEDYKPKRKKVSMGKITAMKKGGKVPKSYYSGLKQKYGTNNKKSGIDGPSKTNKKANAKTNTQVDDFSRMPTKRKKPIKKSPLIAVKEGGSLKPVPADNKGLGKLPQPVRNKMGYMKKGGVVKMRGGGAATRGMNFNRGY